MNDQHVGRDGGEGHRSEVPVGIVGAILVKAWIDDVTRRRNQDGVAVGGRTRGIDRADIAAGTRQVLDIELLGKFIRKLLRDEACHDVGRTGGRERDNDLNGPVGVFRRRGRYRQNRRDQSSECGQSSSERTHDLLPGFFGIVALRGGVPNGYGRGLDARGILEELGIQIAHIGRTTELRPSVFCGRTDFA